MKRAYKKLTRVSRNPKIRGKAKKMGKKISEWKQMVKEMSTRTLMECELGLHSFLGVLGFKEEYDWTGLGIIKSIIRTELDNRGIEWGTLITQINPHSKLGRGEIKLTSTTGKAVGKTTEEMNCKCKHNLMKHNRFNGVGEPFGCVDCECEGFVEEVTYSEDNRVQEEIEKREGIIE